MQKHIVQLGHINRAQAMKPRLLRVVETSLNTHSFGNALLIPTAIRRSAL